MGALNVSVELASLEMGVYALVSHCFDTLSMWHTHYNSELGRTSQVPGPCNEPRENCICFNESNICGCLPGYDITRNERGNPVICQGSVAIFYRLIATAQSQ